MTLRGTGLGAPHGELALRLSTSADGALDGCSMLRSNAGFVGLEGATVPSIAAGAGVSVGNVSKRFPDKDALLRAVYDRFFTEQLAATQFALDPAKWADTPTIELVTTLVAGMVEDYRSRKSLIRSLLLYAQTHTDSEYRVYAERLSMESFRLFEGVLRDRRGTSAITSRPCDRSLLD